MNQALRFAGLGLLLTTVSSQAFVTAINASGNTRRWNLLTPQSGVTTNVVNTNTHAIRFFLANDGYSPANTAAELNAVRAAFAQWQAVSNTYIKFEEGGLVAPTTTISTSDNTNTIFWAKTSTSVGGGNDISGALGVTFTTFGETDNIFRQGDIVFNGVDYHWFTDYFSGNTTDIFVEGVALHEVGHFLGVLHSPLGAATMLWATGSGVSVQAGLYADDISAARYLYPTAATNYGAIKGNVTKNGSAVYGAAVFVRDVGSNTVAGTVTDASGNYLLGALPTGNYQVRVAPLDASGAVGFLVRGYDISHSTSPGGNDFTTADTAFLPTTNKSTTVTANVTNTVDFAVTSGAPAFRITWIRTPTTSSGSYSIKSLPTALRAGLSNRFISVFSDSLPTSGATFTITGNGLTLGTPTYQPGNVFAGLNGITMSISVASNATPGARDFIVTQGANVAYASGFFEVQGTNTDFNFDGFEDTFQRTYFPLFTAIIAGPNADPDGDKMSNYAESIAGTAPTNAASVLKMLSVARTNNTATVRWQSVNGKRYQMLYSTNLASGTWNNLGSVITANSTNTSFADTAATNSYRDYRVQVLP
jgi:hypothetical protein